MQLYKIRGGNKEDLESRKYTIAIGISLGNKWFTTENILDLIEWCFTYTKDTVVVYIADSIHAINIEVRNRRSHASALKKALEMGNETLEEVRSSAEKKFSSNKNSKIIYAHWADLEDDIYKKKKEFLRKFYNENQEFKNTIYTIVSGFLAHEHRKFSDVEIHRFGDYLVEEMPELIAKVPVKGIVFDANAYPSDSPILEFAEEIQKGNKFPEIKKRILDTEPKVFLEVR
jgi:tRNA-dependent cyclodipeptide synthase